MIKLKSFIRTSAVGLVLSMSLGACSLSDLLEGSEPSGSQLIDPKDVKNYTGAVRLHNGALVIFMTSFSDANKDIAVFTDELSVVSAFDARTGLPGEGVRGNLFTYGGLQSARLAAGQATEALRKYGREDSKGLIGHAYAMQGLSTVLLGDMFCSGVPLGSAPLEGNITHSRGLTTSEIYEKAIAAFDSADMFGQDSLPVRTLARVGKGRALLALGRYAEAAEAVSSVNTTDAYKLQYSPPPGIARFWTSPMVSDQSWVLNREGNNGIDWITDSIKNQDVRVPFVADGELYALPLRQAKYVNENSLVTVANGIEARLIEAEAQLQPASQPSGPWLETLNDARATVGLAPLTDPGTEQARVDLLFRERAFWLYLQSTRLGDLRRLVRNYGRLPIQVYAVGIYTNPNRTYSTYGNEYVFDIPESEIEKNPVFNGCFDRKP